MKKLVCIIILSALFLSSLSKVYSQTIDNTQNNVAEFDSSKVPQWAKDLRRFDIIAFGTYPFSIMFLNIANDFFIPEGSVNITGTKHKDTLLMAAGLSLTFATIDIIITIVKRNKERKRLENIPAGSYEIDISPYEGNTGQLLFIKEELEIKQSRISEKIKELQEEE